jgi:BMFP domain-containing protein YqiC
MEIQFIDEREDNTLDAIINAVNAAQKMMKGEWREELHPRDERGRFTVTAASGKEKVEEAYNTVSERYSQLTSEIRDLENKFREAYDKWRKAKEALEASPADPNTLNDMKEAHRAAEAEVSDLKRRIERAYNELDHVTRQAKLLYRERDIARSPVLGKADLAYELAKREWIISKAREILSIAHRTRPLTEDEERKIASALEELKKLGGLE